ncbi:MAG: isoprenyl transferase [Acidaminococcaceae bacterium]|nr:isoprenyl transferase [Acidaminococcaceae bacterium]
MLKNLFRASTTIKDVPVAEVKDVDLTHIPQHVAIIMDGNGRWAKAQGKPRTYGHSAGAKTLKTIVRFADKLGVKVLSAYAFSTENWKRPITEVNFIMELLSRYLTSEIQDFKDNNVQVRFMGSREGLPPVVNAKMNHAIEETKNNTGIVLNLAVNYGGQAEIITAVKKIVQDAKLGALSPEDINNSVFENYLYSRNLPPPDLLIRPGGDFRISNFMLWQIAYAEIWTTETYWPAFTQEMFLEAIKDFQRRDRRYGGLNAGK